MTRHSEDVDVDTVSAGSSDGHFRWSTSIPVKGELGFSPHRSIRCSGALQADLFLDEPTKSQWWMR